MMAARPIVPYLVFEVTTDCNQQLGKAIALRLQQKTAESLPNMLEPPGWRKAS